MIDLVVNNRKSSKENVKMNKREQIYKCALCGNVVELVNASTGHLMCCKQEMQLMEEQTADSTTEKHVPIIEEDGTCSKVKVGSTPHPMTEEHHIEWIEVINGDYVNREYLQLGDKAEAKFYVNNQPGLIVRSYCNIHGLWTA